jgi:cyclopropane fatty-acyl-phospholipid synthase-like methyltransferase
MIAAAAAICFARRAVADGAISMEVRNLQHELLPSTSAEQKSRQEAVISLRRFLNRRVRPGNVGHFENEGAPAFAAKHGRRPQSPEEVEEALFLSPGYRLWSAANRSAQEMIWVSVGEPLYADSERIGAAARRRIDASHKKGSLHLDSGYRPSPEVADVDIHLQPGGYALDRGPNDVMAGALYETGGNIYAFGMGAGRMDSKAGSVLRMLEEKFPQVLPPKRVLDIGCSAGSASAAYADLYPEAEVHAVDIGAAMLRYAHARAEALGVAVHFHQMDASNLAFEDGYFDLVVSHNLMHEIGAEKRRAMMSQARRVLRPGGVAVHQDVAIRQAPSVVHHVERNWDTRFNGEAHWQTYAEADLLADMQAAGFASAAIAEHDLAPVHGVNRWYAVSGLKEA